MRSALPTVLVCFIALSSQPALADSLTVEGVAVSEASYRGVTETFGRPAIGFGLEWAGASNVHAGARLLEGHAPDVRQRERSVNIYAGWQSALSDDWIAGTSISYRAYPEGAKDWDFVEYQLAIGWQDRLSIEVAWSPDYYAHNTESLALGIRGFQPLSRSLYLSAELGTVDLTWRDLSGYHYGSIAVGFRHERWVAELSHTRASDEGMDLFGVPLESPELLLEVSYLLQ